MLPLHAIGKLGRSYLAGLEGLHRFADVADTAGIRNGCSEPVSFVVATEKLVSRSVPDNQEEVPLPWLHVQRHHLLSLPVNCYVEEGAEANRGERPR